MTQEVFENLSRSAQERYLFQKEILSGKYGEPGLPFMTTRALANARQISVVTAHNILSELCDTGYLELRGKKYYLSHAKLMEDHYRHTNIIGMLVPQLNNEFFSSLCDTVVESFRQKGYEVLILNATYSAEEERKLIQLLLHMSVAGIVSCIPTAPEKTGLYRSCPIPCVLLGHALEKSKCSSVQVNSFTISQKVAQHLVEQGYRDFLYLGSKSRSLESDIRFTGFQMQLKQSGFELDSRSTLQVSSRNRADDGLIAQLLEEHREPVGVFCYHDLIAAQLYRVCKRLGRRIPQDVGIVGFDDLSIATNLSPSLTTVQYRIASMADMTVKLMIDCIQNPDTPYDNYYVEPNLVIRESSLLSGH